MFIHVCVYIHTISAYALFFFSVSALKPEVRMETEEKQSAGYEVYHQKLVRKPIQIEHRTHDHVMVCVFVLQWSVHTDNFPFLMAGVFR